MKLSYMPEDFKDILHKDSFFCSEDPYTKACKIANRLLKERVLKEIKSRLLCYSTGHAVLSEDIVAEVFEDVV